MKKGLFGGLILMVCMGLALLIVVGLIVLTGCVV